MILLCWCRYVPLHIFRQYMYIVQCLFIHYTFSPDSFGNYSHYVFSLMDVNDTGRINFQVQNVQNTDDASDLCTLYIPHYDLGLPGYPVHHGAGLGQGEDAVGGQALRHWRGRVHQRRGARGRDIFSEFSCLLSIVQQYISWIFPRYLIWWVEAKRTRS